MNAATSQPQITDNDRLGLTLFLATIFHGIVILGITFSMAPDAESENLPALDVILVQSHNPSEAEDAKFLAQVSQQGGGNEEDSVRPTDLFTAPTLAQQPGIALASTRQHRNSENQQEKLELLQQKSSDYKVTTDNRQSEEDIARQDDATQQHNQNVARLAQEISNEIKLMAERSRTRYLNSSTKEFTPARYMREWINRVERIGNLNYPDQARRQKLSGTLILDVVIDADGKLVKTDLRQSSGHQLLDDAAKRIVQLAAPYEPFPAKLREEADIIHITRSWEFLSDNSLRTN